MVNPWLAGDVNADGVVDVLDIGLISARWGGPPKGTLGYHPMADLNEDGTINISDVALVSANRDKTGNRADYINDPMLWDTPHGSTDWIKSSYSWGGTPNSFTHFEVWDDGDQYLFDGKAPRGFHGAVTVYGGGVTGVSKISQGRHPWGVEGNEFEPIEFNNGINNHRLFARMKYNLLDAGYWCGFGIDMWGIFKTPQRFLQTGWVTQFELFYYYTLNGAAGGLIPPWIVYSIGRNEASVGNWILLNYKANIGAPNQNTWLDIDIDLDIFFSGFANGYITSIEPMVEVINGAGEVWFDRIFYGKPPAISQTQIVEEEAQKAQKQKKHLVI